MSVVYFLTAIVLAASIFLGGGTRVGFGGDVVIQLLAVPLLLAALWVLLEKDHKLEGKAKSLALPVILMLIAVIAVSMQLLPLPNLLWPDGRVLRLPTQLVLLAEGNPWNSISLSPHQTLASGASLIVPTAVFLGVATLDVAARLILYKLIIFLGAISLLLGLLQIAQGAESSLRFYEFTNTTEAVGFFANRNHFAALLYVTLVLVSVWFIVSIQSSLKFGAINSSAILKFSVVLALLIALLAGLAIARSRAGVILSIVALVAIFLLVGLSVRRSKRDVKAEVSKINRILIFFTFFGVLFAAQFGLGRLLTRFDRDPFEDLRVPLASTTFETALQFPLGSGIGSFVNVYAAVEKTSHIFRGYANRAHNDFLEVMLELGLVGVLMVALFAVWFLGRSYSVWSRLQYISYQVDEFTLLQRASTIVVMLLLLHSFVDYPLRTTALSAIFAFCCAILLMPFRVQQTPPRRAEGSSDASHDAVGWRQPVRRESWGDDIDWPDTWQPDDGKP